MKPGDDTVEQQLSQAAVLSAALGTGVLTRLAEHEETPAELAAALGLDARAVHLVMDVLAALGFAAKVGARFRASDALGHYLSRTAMGAASMHLWSHVRPFLESGEPIMRSDGDDGERAHLYQQAVAGLAQRWGESAALLADRLDPLPAEILDVGAGSGVWSLAIAARRDDAHVTALDLPGVLPRFSERAERLALTERTSLLPGSWFDVVVPAHRFDLVVLANVLHLEPAADAQRLLERAAQGVRRGGRLLIIDAITDHTPERERAIALYALHLGMRTATGTPHKREALESWLREAGLEVTELISLPKSAALVAQRP